ncbi:hypothetical protein EV424DRAFT_1345648 [Suillus variegatus]|nr:hypothetical protein EV424DRAFT_1345648 [Suillus variegatus]
MPSSTHHAKDSTDSVTLQNITAIARDYARASCTKYFMKRGDGMQSFEVPIRRGHGKERILVWPALLLLEVVLLTVARQIFVGLWIGAHNLFSMMKSIVILENHFAGYDASGDIPDTATDVRPPISPYQHVILQQSPSPDPLQTLMTAIFSHPRCGRTQTASLDDEDTRLSTEAVTRLKFPLQFTPSLQGSHYHCRRQALPSAFSLRQGSARELSSFTVGHSTLYLAMLSTFFEMAGYKSYNHAYRSN